MSAVWRGSDVWCNEFRFVGSNLRDADRYVSKALSICTRKARNIPLENRLLGLKCEVRFGFPQSELSIFEQLLELVIREVTVCHNAEVVVDKGEEREKIESCGALLDILFISLLSSLDFLPPRNLSEVNICLRQQYT